MRIEELPGGSLLLATASNVDVSSSSVDSEVESRAFDGERKKTLIRLRKQVEATIRKCSQWLNKITEECFLKSPWTVAVRRGRHLQKQTWPTSTTFDFRVVGMLGPNTGTTGCKIKLLSIKL